MGEAYVSIQGKKRRILGVKVMVACGCKNPLRCIDCEGSGVGEMDATGPELRAFLDCEDSRAQGETDVAQ